MFGTSGSSALPLNVADEGTSVSGRKVRNDERQISVEIRLLTRINLKYMQDILVMQGNKCLVRI
jgi:hypothetical protein